MKTLDRRRGSYSTEKVTTAEMKMSAWTGEQDRVRSRKVQLDSGLVSDCITVVELTLE